MSPAIATATRCSCGDSVLLVELPSFAHPAHRWQAHCDRCLDPTEDAGVGAHVVGYGLTPAEALWSWQDAHDSALGDRISWTVVTTAQDVHDQARAEFARPMQLVEGWLTWQQAQALGLPAKQIDVLYYEPGPRPAYPIPGGA